MRTTYILGGDIPETLADNSAMKQVFTPDATEGPLRRQAPRKPGGTGVMLVIAALTIGGGIIAIFNLSLLLRSLLG